MIKRFLAALGVVVALSACTVEVKSQPTPTPTVTTTADPAPAPEPAVTESSQFLDYVTSDSAALDQWPDSELLTAGDAICTGFTGGLSLEEVTQVLIDSDLTEDELIPLVIASVKYLCPENADAILEYEDTTSA